MTTPLAGPLKRALDIEGEPYTLTIDPQGLKLVAKGHRKGYALAWSALVNGDAALATALTASLAGAPSTRSAPAASAQPAPVPAAGRRKRR